MLMHTQRRSIIQGCKTPESLLLAGLSKQQAQLPSKLLLEPVQLLHQVCDCLRAVHPAGLPRTAPLSQLQQHHEPAQMQGPWQEALHDLGRFQRPWACGAVGAMGHLQARLQGLKKEEKGRCVKGVRAW